ncbi:MAG: hypothetical protein IKW48_01720 [Akkermansia sp.]|nr:hypothetical protein [Akkermansia sp.]
MKDKEHSLLYHTMHSRPMPGCLPLFFLMALVAVGAGLWFAPVEMPKRLMPKGVGRVGVKNDRLTDFVVRRTSPLPLHLPLHADPEYQEDMAAAAMPLLRPVSILPPPPMPIFDAAPDSSVLNAEELLAYPEPPGQSVETAPAPVEPENSGEEVQP